MNYTFLLVLGAILVLAAPFVLKGAEREARARFADLDAREGLKTIQLAEAQSREALHMQRLAELQELLNAQVADAKQFDEMRRRLESPPPVTARLSGTSDTTDLFGTVDLIQIFTDADEDRFPQNRVQEAEQPAIRVEVLERAFSWSQRDDKRAKA